MNLYLKRIEKRKSLWLSGNLCLFLMLVTIGHSCVEEGTSISPATQLPATIRVEVKAGDINSIYSRAINETTINDIHILVYDQNSNLIGHNYSQKSTIEVTTLSGDNYTIYVIANTGDATLFDGVTASTEQKLKDKTTDLLNSWEQLTTPSRIIMTGSRSGVKITPEANVLDAISVSRIAAKIILDINVKAESDIVIKGYQLCNLPALSYYLPRPMTTETEETDLEGETGADAPVPSETTHWINSPLNNINDATTLSTTFYMSENRPGTNNSITEQKNKSEANAPDRATYLLVSGTGPNYNITWRIYLGANNSSNFNIKRNASYEYKITLARNDADTRVSVKELPPTKVGGEANCYMITPVSAITIPVVRANQSTISLEGSTYNSATKTYTQIEANTPWTAQIVWQSSKDLITLSDDSGVGPDKRFTVTAMGATTGNALVAAKNGNKILWSWHIWISDYDGTQTITNTNKHGHKYVFMDRSLGATSNVVDDLKSCGLHYQWGRKDPFPGIGQGDNWNASTIKVYDTDGIEVNISSSRVYNANNFTNSVRNPEWFYINLKDPYNWFTTDAASQDLNLWGGENKTTPAAKTVFDPCPEGWRVPPYWGGTSEDASPFYGMGTFTTSNKKYGYTSTTLAYWSAGGFWNGNIGGIGDLEEGDYWTASTDSDCWAYMVNFNISSGSGSAWLDRKGACDGFFVRCVKE